MDKEGKHLYWDYDNIDKNWTQNTKIPVFTCISNSSAHQQRPAPINVLRYGSRRAPHTLLSAIFISTLTIKGCDCCLDPLARANIIFVV